MSSDIENQSKGSVLEVFMTFLKLGLTSFGGPNRAPWLFPP